MFKVPTLERKIKENKIALKNGKDFQCPRTDLNYIGDLRVLIS